MSRLNQPIPIDVSRETEDMLRLVVRKTTKVADSKRNRQRVREKSGLSGVLYYVQTGDWSQCEIPSYLSVNNELCVIGKLLLRGDRIAIPQSLQRTVLKSAHEGQQGVTKRKVVCEQMHGGQN